MGTLLLSLKPIFRLSLRKERKIERLSERGSGAPSRLSVAAPNVMQVTYLQCGEEVVFEFSEKRYQSNLWPRGLRHVGAP